MRKIWITWIVCVLCVGMALSLAACGQDATPTEQEPTETVTEETRRNPIVRFTFSTGDVITVELFPDEAPITVANFLTYVNEGYYKGTVIHRVESIVIQGGGYVIKNNNYVNGKLKHDPIKGEFASNGVNNKVSHTAGTLSMARLPDDNDSATSEFFFCVTDYTYWDGDYAAFGRVVDESSLEAIRNISKTPTIEKTTFPSSPVIINSVQVISQ